MSKKVDKKKGAGTGDAQESAVPGLMVKGNGDLHRCLKKIKEINCDLGKIVEEITIKEYVVAEKPIDLNPPPNENEEVKYNRRKQNERNAAYNDALIAKREVAITKLCNILPERSVSWIKRNHQDVIDNSYLNRFCRLLPQALVADDSTPIEERKEKVADMRKTNKKHRIYSKEQLGVQCEKMREIEAGCMALGLPLTNEEIIYDMMHKLSGPLADICADWERRQHEAAVRSVNLHGAALNNMRMNVLGLLPTDLTTFESYVRNYAIVEQGNDIRSYSHTTFVTMQKRIEELSEIVAGSEAGSDVDSMFFTKNHPAKRPKFKPSGGGKLADIKCHLCNNTGHVMRKCPSQTCQLCSKKGHCAGDCPDTK